MASDDNGAALAGPSAGLLEAVRQVLSPLVRVLIHFGITFPALGGLLKQVYVTVAAERFALTERAMSDSRVSLLTGVHRKDVSALRAERPELPRRSAQPGLAGQVISRWVGHPDWHDETGAPLPLPRTPQPDRGDRSFEGLVAGISRDIRPRTLLDELLRTGQVQEGTDGLLRVAATADVPRGDLERLAYYFGRNLADHIEAAGHNLVGGAPPHFERALAFDGLSPGAIAILTTQAEHLGMEMLVRLNEMAVGLAERGPPAPGAAQRFMAGLYLYAARDPAPRAEDTP